MHKKIAVVVGLGEVGLPLLQLVSQVYEGIGVDIGPPRVLTQKVDVMHVCYPFSITDFVGETVRYIERFKPALTVINSTVAVGTTRAIAESSGRSVVNSPVRGKHARMLDDMRHYVKFIGAIDPQAGQAAAAHFQSLGLKTKVLSSPESTELAKLSETTYFGLLIAWAQEIERFCDRFNENYDEVASFWEEIKYLPPVTYFPGIIGGHCVMPNLEILSRFDHSPFLKAIEDSNLKKIRREASKEPQPAEQLDTGTRTQVSSHVAPAGRARSTAVGS